MLIFLGVLLLLWPVVHSQPFICRPICWSMLDRPMICRPICRPIPKHRSTYWLIVDRYPAGSWPITYRHGHGRYVHRHQWKFNQNIGRLFVDSGSTCQSHVGRESFKYRSSHLLMHRSMYWSRYPKRYLVRKMLLLACTTINTYILSLCTCL